MQYSVIHFSFRLTGYINQLKDKVLIELWKRIWDGLQDDYFEIFSGGESDGAGGVGKLLTFQQRRDGVIGIQMPKDCYVAKMTPCSQDTEEIKSNRW